jgi:MFS family permease
MLSLAYLLSIMDRYLLSVVLEQVKQDLLLTDTQLGILQGPSFVVLFLLASLPLGRMADVSNRRLIVVAGLGLWSICTIACGMTDSFAGLLLARLGVGMGEAALLPCAMSLIAAYFSSNMLGRGVSIYSMGGSFGRVAAFAGGGAMFAWFAATGGLKLFGGDSFRPWQSVFLVAGVTGLVVALLFLLTIREPPRSVQKNRSGELRAGFAHFWRNRWAYMAICMPFSMSTATAMLLGAWSVSFYSRSHGMSTAAASQLVGFTGLMFGPVGHLFGGWLNDLLRKRGDMGPQPRVLAVVLATATLCITIFATASTVPVAAAAYGVAYFALCVAGPTGFSGVQLPTPGGQRGFISSVFLFFYTALGTGLGPLLVGVASDHYFHSEAMLGRAMIASTAIVALIGIPFALLGRRAFARAVQLNEARNTTSVALRASLSPVRHAGYTGRKAR